MPWLIAIMIIIIGFSNSFLMTAICLMLTGFCFVSFSSSCNSTVQITSGDQYRGRIMSIYTLVFAGSTPLGNLYAGLITNHFGPRTGFFACGSVIIILMGLFVLLWKKEGAKLDVSELQEKQIVKET
jgi:MFS family permease